MLYFQRLFGCINFFQHPPITQTEEVGRSLVNDPIFAHSKNIQRILITGFDQLVFIKGNHAIRHALQNALVVVLHGLHFTKQFGIFKGNRDLRGKCGQALLILLVKRATTLIQHLSDANFLARLINHRNTKHGAGEKIILLVRRRVKTEISVGMRYIDSLASGENSTGNTRRVWKANTACGQTITNQQGKQTRFFVIEKHR